MSYSRSFQGYRPPRRYDGNPWTAALVQESATKTGTYSLIDTISLSPVDSDPTSPQLRNFTTDLATLPSGWYRIDWRDAASSVFVGDPVKVSGVPATGGATLSDLTNDVVNIGGVDLTTTEAHRFLNEGYIRLVTESGWNRENVEIGPSISGESAYDLPASVYRVLRVSLNGKPLEQTSLEEVEHMTLNDVFFRGYGAYYLGAGDQVVVYPAPDANGLPISALCVTAPAPMTEDDDEPNVPQQFRGALRDYAAGVGQGYAEDNADQRLLYENEFQRAIGDLRHLRLGKDRYGPVQMKVQGIHF